MFFANSVSGAGDGADTDMSRSHAQTARVESAALHKLTDRTAGNGSLMRTASVALAYLDDEPALVEAARSVSELTHHDPEAGDACVLWCRAIRHAILARRHSQAVGARHQWPEHRLTPIAARARFCDTRRARSSWSEANCTLASGRTWSGAAAAGEHHADKDQIHRGPPRMAPKRANGQHNTRAGNP